MGYKIIYIFSPTRGKLALGKEKKRLERMRVIMTSVTTRIRVITNIVPFDWSCLALKPPIPPDIFLPPPQSVIKPG